MRGQAVHLLAASLLFLLDAWVYGQGLLSLLVLLFTFAVLLPLWLSARGDDEELARRRGLRALFYGVGAVCALIATMASSRGTERRAAEVVSACRMHKAKEGVFPERLSDLVPAYLPEVPKARKTLFYGEFLYSAAPGSHRLAWTVLPPFGRRWVRLEDGQTGILD